MFPNTHISRQVARAPGQADQIYPGFAQDQGRVADPNVPGEAEAIAEQMEGVPASGWGEMAAAASTKDLRIGTGICLLTEHNPITLAKQAASLDFLSNGRFELGIGAGWNAEEMLNHGTDFKSRFKVMSERAKAIKKLWTEEAAEFHGEFVDFDPVWCFPKPAQNPHPPILIGGESDHTLRRVVEYGDGWFPRARGGFDAAENVNRLRTIAEEAGRPMSSLTVSIFGAPPKSAVLEDFAQAGVTRSILALPSEDREEILPRLDRYTELLQNHK